MQFSKTIPLNEIRKIQIYHNSIGYRESEADAILRSTGGSFLLGGPIFLSNLTACCHLKAEGYVECDPGYTVDILQWNEDVQDYGMGRTPSDAENYIECVALIVNGKPVEKPSYQPDMGGQRPRQAIGSKEGRFAYIVTENAYTPEGLRDVLVSSGWDGAIMLDGGGSVYYLDLEGNRIMCDPDRVLPYYIVVFLKENEEHMSATASILLNIAKKELGYKESPANSNKTKFGAWYGLDGQPWCMMFVQWCFAQAGVPLPARTASCGELMRAAKGAGQWKTGDYAPGDVVIYDFPGGAATDHCGIVESVSADYVTAIEGNTAVGNDSNGGMVMRRTRPLSQVVGVVRPQFMEDNMDIEALTEEQLIRLAERMQAALGKRPISQTLALELQEAVGMGITDGSNPNAFCTRVQAAVMVKRSM